MLSFKEFLLSEELTPTIYKNVGATALMNLSKQHGTTRFSIQHDTCNAGDAHHFWHHFKLSKNSDEEALSNMKFENYDWTASDKNKSVDIGKANIQYTINPDNTGVIKMLGVDPKNRGKGHARKALGDFLKTADENKTTMYLDAVQMGFHKTALSKANLEGFYKSVGFKRNGKTKEGSEREYVRKPQ